MFNTIWLVISTQSSYPISFQHEFLITKTVVSGKNKFIFRFFFRHNYNKSLWKNKFFVSSPLVCAPPQLRLFPSPTTCTVDHFERSRFSNSQSPNNFTGKHKIVSHPTRSQESVKHKSTFIFTLRTIYPSMTSMAQLDISPEIENPHISPSINKWFLPADNKDEILAAFLQHKADKFSKMTVENISQQICSEKMVYQISQRWSARLCSADTWRRRGAESGVEGTYDHDG